MIECMAITIWQPWASAVACGLKRFETRAWPTPYRGLLLIHASKRWSEDHAEFHRDLISRLRGLRSHLGEDDVDAQIVEFEAPPPLGAIVAVGDLVECHLMDADDHKFVIPEVERELGDFDPGRYAWQLENLTRLPNPVPCRGQQGLWIPEAEVFDLVADQLELTMWKVR